MAVHLFTAFSLIQGQTVTVADGDRAMARIQELGRLVKPAAGVMRRVAFSAGDIAARNYVIGLMKKLKLAVRVDAAGNIIGRREGNNEELAPIAFGSHTDAVPNGGMFDGDAGVVAALECIGMMNEHNIRTEHPLEVIDFVDEEGGLTGSQAMVGGLSADRLQLVTNSGKTISRGISDLGGDTAHLASAMVKKGAIAAWLELHIEQGANLDKTGKDIGVVQGIVGLGTWAVTVRGITNHAGTTPMPIRKDPMVTAARFILVVNETVLGISGSQVATVGKISALPGASNVIPASVTMSLDVRDLSREKLDSVFHLIQHKADSLEEKYGTPIEFVSEHQSLPAITDSRIRDMITQSATAAGLTTLALPSGAGHDTQDMAKIAPSAMIFIPSKGGISHSPEESSSASDLAHGITVMYHTLLNMDKVDWSKRAGQ